MTLDVRQDLHPSSQTPKARDWVNLDRLPLPLPTQRITYEAFLVWGEANAMGRGVEWVDGRVVEKPVNDEEHNGIQHLFILLLTLFADDHGGGRVLFENFQMKLNPGLPGREPDVMFVVNDRLHLVHRLYLDGPADIVIEIISPESRRRDSVEKLKEYEAGGVREYWLIDPQRRAASFFQLNAAGQYEAAAVGPDGTFRSEVLAGFWLRTDWLWDRPKVADVMQSWTE